MRRLRFIVVLSLSAVTGTAPALARSATPQLPVDQAPAAIAARGAPPPPLVDPGVLPPLEGTWREHADDIVDYTLRATLDPDTHLVHGEGRIVWRNTSRASVHEIWLHLYLNAFKNERSAFLRERLGGRGSAPPEDWGWIDLRRLALVDGDESKDLLPGIERHRPGDEDETDARVPLPVDIPPGGSITFDVAFDDKLPAIVERTGYQGHFHMIGQWFPKIARLEAEGTWAHFPFHHLSEFYADFGTYDVTLVVPAAYVLGATGPAVESRVEGGLRIERHVQADVHDFAWTAWDRFRTRSETIAGVAVRLLYPPGFDAVAERDLAAVRFALPYEASRYGPYPYAVLTVVHPQEDASEAGGMEYPTLITTEGPWWTPAAVRVPEIVTVHELGHQWFYGLVATNEAAWPFLDEGVNQFAEVDAMGAWRGDGSALDLGGLRVSDAALQAVDSAPAVHDEPVAQPASSFSTGTNYGRLVYARTASLLETMARVYGRDALARALRLYCRRGRFEHPQPDDFIAAFRDVLGVQPADTLRTALFDEGWVDYAVDGVWSDHTALAAGVFDRDGRRETIGHHEDTAWEGSVLLRRRGPLSFPVDVELRGADGSSQRERWDGVGASIRLPWKGAGPLASAAVDPYDRVLVDGNRADDRKAATGYERFAARTLERLTYWMQIAIETISP